MSDRKNPVRTDTAVVQVKVRRDQYAVEFPAFMEADIDVKQPVNESSILTVQATDRDKGVRN